MGNDIVHNVELADCHQFLTDHEPIDLPNELHNVEKAGVPFPAKRTDGKKNKKHKQKKTTVPN